MLGRLQRCSGNFGKDRISDPCRKSKYDSSIVQAVAQSLSYPARKRRREIKEDGRKRRNEKEAKFEIMKDRIKEGNRPKKMKRI
jgi:hypothetical protein